MFSNMADFKNFLALLSSKLNVQECDATKAKCLFSVWLQIKKLANRNATINAKYTILYENY